MFFLGCAITVINLLLWIIFFLKFKKLFSTDQIVENTKEEINRILEDMNRNTLRNIDLIDARTKDLRAIIAEADRHVTLSKNELERQHKTNLFQQEIEKAKQKVIPETPSKRVANTYLKNMEKPKTQVVQESLPFEDQIEKKEDNDLADTVVAPSGTQFKVKTDGSSYAEVPVLGANITYSDNPIKPKDSFNSKVLELNELGFDATEIATRLNRTVSEVQLVIEMMG